MIDATDRRILRELSREGRITNMELAERVSLSASACLRRTKELERTGVIQGYRAVINPDAVGRAFAAYVTVGLSSHSKTALDNFEAAMIEADEVMECHNIAGQFEYLLRIACADLAGYKQFHTEVLGTLAHVTSITSLIIMSSPKDLRSG